MFFCFYEARLFAFQLLELISMVNVLVNAQSAPFAVMACALEKSA